MSGRKTPRKGSAASALKPVSGGRASSLGIQLSKRKLRAFRVLAALAAPLVFFALLEAGLRLAGYGYSTAFLLPASHQGKSVLVQNNRFAWPFLGPRMGRVPEPIVLEQSEPPGTTRIFLFGESAAQGDPQPAFGPARLLQTLLQ